MNKKDRDWARIIDVNLNRLTEGLRVIEDIARFRMGSKSLLHQVRGIRTRLGKRLSSLRRAAMEFRDSEQDPGKPDRFDRLKRKNLEEVLMANFKRAQESARVLEELFKIERGKGKTQPPVNFKQIRFLLYGLEKRAVHQLRGKAVDLDG